MTDREQLETQTKAIFDINLTAEAMAILVLGEAEATRLIYETGERTGTACLARAIEAVYMELKLRHHRATVSAETIRLERCKS